MSEFTLEIIFDDKRWRQIPHLRPRLAKAAAATFKQLPKRLQLSGEITVLLTSNASIRKLNRDFRGRNKPTNVLSFPQFEPSKLPKKGKIRGRIGLGDIALGYQYIVAESKSSHKLLINHTIHLFVHGILHLLGYDHGAKTEAVRMEQLEKRIMAGLGLPDPYVLQLFREPKAH